ncbi:MAG: hypothetical protein LBG84_05025 [Treponema sp.]|jgi:hypothetical protein|nr:hypothetical protein [Treponema sp.]
MSSGPALFRSIAFWQSALMTLPDEVFFQLMRSALGTVKTPFNKQKLLEDLSAFIARPEIQETMAAYIDDQDRRVIAAVALLGEPAPGELESFFTGDLSYSELQGILLNLEERLILYRFREGDACKLALNPGLEKILAPAAADTGILFSSPDFTDPGGTFLSPPVNGRILAALCAFLSGGDVFLRGDIQGSNGKSGLAFRKKIIDEGSRVFPSLDIETLAGGLINLGLLVPEGERLVPEEGKFTAFKVLPGRDRFEYFAAGIAYFLYRGFIPQMGRGLLKNTARLIHAVIRSLPGPKEEGGRLFSESVVIKLTEIQRRTETKNWAAAGSGEFPPSRILFQALVLAGLFSQIHREGKTYYRPAVLEETKAETARARGEGDQNAGETPLIAMDSGFSCILYPEIGFADALDLAAFSTVEETGAIVRFSLSRDSVVRGFDRGFSAAFMWGLLDRLSGGRAEKALKWNLEDWEKRYREVSLNQGTVLTLSGERSYLAQTGALALMIKRTLAPGVYLLSAGADEAAAALRNAGVDIVAKPRGPDPALPGSDKGFPGWLGSSSVLPPLEDSLPGAAPLASTAPLLAPPEAGRGAQTGESAAGTESTAGAIKEKFRTLLGTMNLGRQEREEMESRIERRVVVSETQLKDTPPRGEKLEARSLDYVGKTGVVRQALISGSLLEVVWNAGGERKILGQPENLEKKGGEMILVIKPRDGGETQRIPLGKISLVRRIKQSIFGE